MLIEQNRETITGRILSRHLIQGQSGLTLRYYIATRNGSVVAEVRGQEYVCFCPSKDLAALSKLLQHNGYRTQPLQLKSFQHLPMSAIYCRSTKDYRHLLRVAKDLGVSLHEADIKPQQRFLTERFIALDIECEGYFEHQISQAIFVITRARKAAIDVNLKAISLDFECSGHGELYSVALYGKSYRKVILVGKETDVCQVTKNNQQSFGKQEYIEFVADEAALITCLIAWFEAYDPDVIIGWAVVTFDLALLYRRAKKLGIDLTIGRQNQALGWKVEDKYRPETLNLPGRVVLDGIDWLKAAFYHFERYSLEFVARALLGEGKAIEQVDNRLEEIETMFIQDKPALAHYNLTDSRLVWDIFESTKLFDFAIARAQLTGLELGRVGASVEAFNRLYLPHLHRSGFIAPAEPVSKGIESPGGYVMDSIPGFYKDILVFDFKSLYPSIIQTFLIDPKGLISTQGEDNLVPGFLGAQFSRNTPILPSLIAELSASREQAKQAKDLPLSQAIKIIMNSLYGVLGSRGCVFHDAKLASSITMRGHEIMLTTKAWIEALGYKVIYGDTDSTFVWLGEKHDVQDVQRFGHELAQQITEKWREKLNCQMSLTSHLVLEYETHFEQFVMPTLRGSSLGSKKRYVGAYTKADSQLEIVFKGMEQVRTDWSPLARRVQYELYERLFTQQPVEQYLQDIIESLWQGKLDQELVFQKRLKRNVEHYKSQSIPHVKAALKLFGMNGDSKVIKRGALVEYMITINGAEPTQHLQSAIDYSYYLDKQLLPIAEPVFAVLGKEITTITSNQMSLL